MNEVSVFESAPEHWERVRLKFLVRDDVPAEKQKELTDAEEASFLPMEAIGEEGSLDLSETVSIDDVANRYTQFFENDVLVAKITPCFENGKGAVARRLVNGIGYGTTELYVLRPREDVLPEYLYYLTANPDFRKRGEAAMTGAAGQKRVPREFIQNYRVAVPPVEEQKQIIHALENRLRQLDELLQAKNKLLDELDEKRRGVIARAVTRGLDDGVPMRDSGHPWISEIPAHWEFRRLATLFREIDERNEPELPLLHVSLNTGVTKREFEDDRIERVASDFSTYKVARRGDIVFNKMRMWQGAVGVAPIDGLVSPDYVVARPGDEVNPSYFENLFRTPLMNAEFARHSHGLVWDRLRLY